ncbi:transposase [Streptomyces durbertensis]|uniref:Transposase n=1 Tax=Streptomyces durbertensis TaxID=2448886 RepID=A0ABR6ECT0_9ACTN|nr:transposase [Streptomyces durbertensis]MBB1242897.1 transposase [Streptomyces durbertensis]
MEVSSRSPHVRVDGSAGPRPDLLELLGQRFTRVEPRDRALAYVRALLADPARGSAAEIAVRAGADSAWSTQRLLTRAVWDADQLRDSVRAHVVTLLGASGPCLVLRRHETARAGRSAVAVTPTGARGTGRERNTQVAALLCYVSGGVGALIDRELHLPPQWVSDPARCARAGVPAEHVRDRGMADLGQRMLERAAAAEVPVDWVVAGPDFADPRLRQWLCRRRLPFCVELPQLPGPAPEPEAATPRVEAGREEAWHLLGRGLGPVYGRPAPGFRLTLLARRQASGYTSRFLLHAPVTAPGVPAARATAAAGAAAARAVREADERAGLSSHQVRSWVAWYRHTTLAMTAAALRLEGRLETPARKVSRTPRPADSEGGVPDDSELDSKA